MSNSYDAITWAIRARGISAGAYRLLIALAKRVGRRGFDVWPSHKKMAHDAEMSVASVRRNIDELIGAMLIERIPSARPDGSQSSNVYRLQVRSAHDFGASPSQWIRPDDGQDEDDDEDDGRVLNMSRGGAQSEQGGLFADEHPPLLAGEHPYELESERTESIELSEDDVVEAFVERWQTLSEEVERFQRIGRIGKRKASLLARVREYVPSMERDATLALLDRVFATVRGSRFLRGEVKPFKADPAWMLTPTYFPKLEETGYAQDAAPGGGGYRADDRDRSHVAAGQAARDILRAGGGTPRRSARELAGLTGTGPAHDR